MLTKTMFNVVILPLTLCLKQDAKNLPERQMSQSVQKYTQDIYKIGGGGWLAGPARADIFWYMLCVYK